MNQKLNLGVNSAELKKFGISTKDINLSYKSIDDLKKDTPYMVLAKVVENNYMSIDGSPVPMTKGDTLVMPLTFYALGKRQKGSRRKVLKPTHQTFKRAFNRYNGQDLTDKTLLIMRQGGIGDLMFTQPLIKYLKHKYPSCRIVFTCAPRFAHVFKCWPKGLLTGVIPVPFSYEHMKRADYHLSFEGGIERCEEAKVKNSYDIFSEIAGLDFDKTDPLYKTSLVPHQESTIKLEEHLPENYVVIQMRASSPIRMISSVKWKEITDKLIDLGYNIVLMDSKEMKQNYEDFLEKEQWNKEKIFNLCEYSEDVTYAVSAIAKSKGVIAVDSAFTHLAGALDKPTVGLYGPFSGDLRVRYQKTVDYVETKESGCPQYKCYYHHNEILRCNSITSGEQPLCLEEISSEDVINKFSKLVSDNEEESV